LNNHLFGACMCCSYICCIRL